MALHLDLSFKTGTKTPGPIHRAGQKAQYEYYEVMIRISCVINDCRRELNALYK
jgi:hypothetical protein